MNDTHPGDREVALVTSFVALADSLRPDFGVIDTMDLLVGACTDFTTASEAGVVLVGAAGELHVVASSSERAMDAEEAQLGVSAGPCFDAVRAGAIVDVPDIAAEAYRWPDFARLAHDRGLLAAHAIPLRSGTTNLGSLNLFADTVGGLNSRETAVVQAMADVASISILQRDAIVQHAGTNAQLQRALDSRILIEQAKGVLAQRHGIAVDDAFRRLRSHARNEGLRLQDIARDVVENRLTV